MKMRAMACALVTMATFTVVGCDAGSPPIDENQPGEGGSSSTGSDSSGSSGSESGPSGSSGSGEQNMPLDPLNVIDDLDDGDALIKAANGRLGAWYTYNDESETGSQTPAAGDNFDPAEGGPEGSVYAARTSGSGFDSWGAGMGFDLNNEGDEEGGTGIKNPYDASGLQGIAFMAKGNTPVRFKVLVDGVVPTVEGGSCEDEELCNDAHSTIVALGDEWQQQVIYFDELFQEGWGVSAEFDTSLLMGIQFQVSAGTEFDFSIDEIGFF